MAAPAVLGYAGPAAANDRVAGPLAASAGVIAIWEATRPLRWVNVALGLWLLLAPWAFGYAPTPLVDSSVVGLLLIVCALVRGEIGASFGGGWRALWQPRLREAEDRDAARHRARVRERRGRA